MHLDVRIALAVLEVVVMLHAMGRDLGNVALSGAGRLLLGRLSEIEIRIIFLLVLLNMRVIGIEANAAEVVGILRVPRATLAATSVATLGPSIGTLAMRTGATTSSAITHLYRKRFTNQKRMKKEGDNGADKRRLREIPRGMKK